MGSAVSKLPPEERVLGLTIQGGHLSLNSIRKVAQGPISELLEWVIFDYLWNFIEREAKYISKKASVLAQVDLGDCNPPNDPFVDDRFTFVWLSQFEFPLLAEDENRYSIPGVLPQFPREEFFPEEGYPDPGVFCNLPRELSCLVCSKVGTAQELCQSIRAFRGDKQSVDLLTAELERLLVVGLASSVFRALALDRLSVLPGERDFVDSQRYTLWDSALADFPYRVRECRTPPVESPEQELVDASARDSSGQGTESVWDRPAEFTGADWGAATGWG